MLLIVAVWVVLRQKQVGQGNRSIVQKAHSSIRKVNKQLNTKLTQVVKKNQHPINNWIKDRVDNFGKEKTQLMSVNKDC